MINQMINLENFETELENRLAKYQVRYNVTNADLAWMLLRIGTNYYFRDICSRGGNGNGQPVGMGVGNTEIFGDR
jgi:hypothetical protein